MQNDTRTVFVSLLPSFILLLVFLFLIFFARKRVDKKTATSLDNLKEQDFEKWKKVVKFNAYLKFLGWCGAGGLALSGATYRYFNFPNEEKLFVWFGGCIAILFIWAGVSSYLSEIKKIGK